MQPIDAVVLIPGYLWVGMGLRLRRRACSWTPWLFIWPDQVAVDHKHIKQMEHDYQTSPEQIVERFLERLREETREDHREQHSVPDKHEDEEEPIDVGLLRKSGQ